MVEDDLRWIGRETERSTALGAIGARLREAAETGEVLERAVREVREAFGADRCTVYARDPSDPGYAVIAAEEARAGLVPEPRRLRITEAWIEPCLVDADVVRIENAAEHHRGEALRAAGTTSALLVPFSIAGEVAAGLAVAYVAQHDFDELELLTLRSIALQAEFATTQAKLLAAEAERRKRFDNLERTMLALGDARETQDVLAIVARGLVHDLKRPCSAYELRDGAFHPIASGQPATLSRPLQAEAFDLDTLRQRVLTRHEGRDLVAISSDGQLRAVLALDCSTEPLSDDETKFLRALAAHAALALTSALGFDQLRRYAAEGAALNEAARTILGFTSVEPLAAALCRLALRLVRAERACIYERRGGELVLVGSTPTEGSPLPEKSLPLDGFDETSTHVISHSFPLGSLDPHDHNGLLVVSRSHDAFERVEVRLLEALVSLAALAMRNVDLYEQSTRANAALAESNAFKDDLMAMFAHDFKGPLTVISGFSELLLESESSEVRKCVETIIEQTRRLARLSEDALALAATQTTGFSLQRRHEDLVAFVRETIRPLDRGGRIVVDAPGGAVGVSFDRSRLRHAVENVVGNALKYSTGPVIVRIVSAGEAARIDVTDRGIGVPAEDQEKIFARFGRAGNARARGVAGSGVGLYIARKIVEVHGGRLTMTSLENEGSTFSLILPAGAATA